MTIVLPNSIEWVQAVLAAWKLGAVPQPLSARLPDAELEALLELQPRALLVGRDDPRGVIPSVPGDFTPDPALSDAPLPEAVSPVWKAMASGGSTGRPKLIEAGGDSRFPAARRAIRLGAQEGDVNLLVGSAEPQHRLHHRSRSACCMGHHLVLMPRFDAARVPAAGHRAPGRRSWRRCRRSCSGCCRSTAPTPTPTTCRRSGGSGIWPRRARLRSNRPGSTCSGPRWSGSCTAAPNFRR